MAAAEEGELSVELTTAYELSDEEARAIVAQIEQRSGRRVEATREVDPDLIGGMVLQVGARRVDASIRGRLEQLSRDLRTRV
jgi:F-type H+-transporting ATPase subunit delta